MDQFEIPLRKERTKPYLVLSALILLVNWIFFIMLAVYTRDTLSVATASVVGGIPLIFWFLGKGKSSNSLPSWKTVMLILCILGFIINGYWWAALAMVCLAYLFQIAMRPLLVKVRAENIQYPSFPRQEIAWSDLNNIIIKGGILTIDFRNNKLAQVAVADEWYKDSTDQEETFNQFCAQYLAGKTKSSNS